MPKKRGRGRPSKLTDKVRARLMASLKGANTYKCACRAAGIGYSTFEAWMARGERQRVGEYREFREQVLETCSLAEEELVRRWQAQTIGDWRACRELLAMRFPEDWVRRQTYEVSGPGGGPIEVRAQDVAASDKELEAWRRERDRKPKPGGKRNAQVPR
jgi:hypothetical protein